MMLSKIVKYRVYCVIFRRPSSPSFCNRSRYGNTTVINCRMMDEVMYGMMPSAKIVSRRKLPPLNRSKMPSTEPGRLLEEIFQHAGVDAGCRDVRAEAVHRQQPQREEQPVPQILDAEEIRECVQETIHTGSSGNPITLPPQTCRRPWRSFPWPTH